MSCCDPYEIETESEQEEEGKCPSCGGDVIICHHSQRIYAKRGCNYSPCDCFTCGSTTCDQSC